MTKNKNLAKYIRNLKDQGRTKKNIGGDDEHDCFVETSSSMIF